MPPGWPSGGQFHQAFVFVKRTLCQIQSTQIFNKK
jgi:hypothetical protein